MRLVEEARDLLRTLNFDAERCNERSAMTLLAILHLGPEDRWAASKDPLLGTRAIMDWISERYRVVYAPNSRETIRRFTLHQFVDAGLVVENPDQPDRPTNSPRWCYQIEASALAVFRAHNGPDAKRLIKDYLARRPGLVAMYANERAQHRIPVTLLDGSEVTLAPGGQNVLIQQVVHEFCTRWTPEGRVLYLGDADTKVGAEEIRAFAELGVHIDSHGKMPDLVVHLPDRNWLVLIEAASSHGPVDATRRGELVDLFTGCTADLVYVSAFPSRAVMRRYLNVVAWESEAWCADSPSHLIHFNGERFLGPYDH